MDESAHSHSSVYGPEDYQRKVGTEFDQLIRGAETISSNPPDFAFEMESTGRGDCDCDHEAEQSIEA
jgi:hypothetical protein